MQKKMFLDTSFKSAIYCYYKIDCSDEIVNDEREQILRDNFSRVIASIDLKLPGFENDYQLCEHFFAVIEFSGLKKPFKTLMEEHYVAIEQCFPAGSDIDHCIDSSSNDEILSAKLDAMLNQTLDKLNAIFACIVDDEEIKNKIAEKLRKYACHTYVKAIEQNARNVYEDLLLNRKNSPSFKSICLWFSWEAVVRRTFTDNKLNEWKITQVLLGYYLGARQRTNISGIILVGKIEGKNTLFRQNEELVDSYILELLFMGELNEDTGKRNPIMVVSADEGIEKKLNLIAQAVMKLKKEVDNSQFLAHKKFDLVPGILIQVKKKDPNHEPKIIDIKRDILAQY
jgi:hypothetical protein